MFQTVLLLEVSKLKSRPDKELYLLVFLPLFDKVYDILDHKIYRDTEFWNWTKINNIVI